MQCGRRVLDQGKSEVLTRWITRAPIVVSAIVGDTTARHRSDENGRAHSDNQSAQEEGSIKSENLGNPARTAWTVPPERNLNGRSFGVRTATNRATFQAFGLVVEIDDGPIHCFWGA
jgi:hypothetical protein